MSMHKIPLNEIERSGLEKYKLTIGKPSQSSDFFRCGVHHTIESVREDRDDLISALEWAIKNIDSNCKSTSYYETITNLLSYVKSKEF